MTNSPGDASNRPETRRAGVDPTPGAGPAPEPGPASGPTSGPTSGEAEDGELRVGGEIDDFLLVDLLGEGAFAKVFLAHQKSLHRTVALKVSEAESEEAQTLAQLDHPNIVRVFDQRDLPERDLHLL